MMEFPIVFHTFCIVSFIFLLFTVKDSESFLFPLLPGVQKPLPKTYTAYQPGPVCKPYGEILTPKTEKEVRVIVLSAIASKKKLKAFGSRHSSTDIICTEPGGGVAMDMSSYKGVRMNPADKSVTALAGVRMKELGEYLHSKQRALQITPAFGDITIGGALGTGAHGTSLKYETSLSGQTIALKIIDGSGKIRNITAPEELRSYRVHLGLLGVILEVTLATVPLFKVKIHNYELGDGMLMNGTWESMVRGSDTVTMYWFPSVSKLVISNGTFVPASTPGNAKSNANVPPTSELFNQLSVPAIEILQTIHSVEGMSLMERIFQTSLTKIIPDFPPILTEDGVTLKNPAVGYPHLMTVANCGKDCPWFHAPNNMYYIDNELSLDVKDMGIVIKTIKDILAKSPAAFPFQGFYIRFSKASDSYMSTTYKRDTIHLEYFPVKRRNPYENQITGMTAYSAIMQILAFKFGGRTHWGKSGLFYHTRQMLQLKMIKGGLREFLKQMKQSDPKQLFLNNFGRRLMNISEVMDSDPNTKHCALLDNCICRRNGDCALDQVCGTIQGYPNTVRVCKDSSAAVLIFGVFPDLVNVFSRSFDSILDFFRTVINVFGLLGR